jgi:hypothetical protein
VTAAERELPAVGGGDDTPRIRQRSEANPGVPDDPGRDVEGKRVASRVDQSQFSAGRKHKGHTDVVVVAAGESDRLAVTPGAGVGDDTLIERAGGIAGVNVPQTPNGRVVGFEGDQ